MTLDSLLLELLVDPEDKQPLWYFEADELLYNPRLRRSYPVRDGIPVLLTGEASALSDDEDSALRARLHDAIETGSAPAAS